jgi:hypothetical protein
VIPKTFCRRDLALSHCKPPSGGRIGNPGKRKYRGRAGPNQGPDLRARGSSRPPRYAGIHPGLQDQVAENRQATIPIRQSILEPRGPGINADDFGLAPGVNRAIMELQEASTLSRDDVAKLVWSRSRSISPSASVFLPQSEMRRSFENERHYAHEKASAVLHLKESTQKFLGWDHEQKARTSQTKEKARSALD